MPNIEGKVVKIISDSEIIINLGSKDGVKEGDRFLIYQLGEEIKDPDTDKMLDTLEIVKGRVKIVHVQPNISTCITDEYEHKTKKIIRGNPLAGVLFGYYTEEHELEEIKKPLIDVKVKDLVRKIKLTYSTTHDDM
ncbi:MAG: FlgT C-terminal domain-containing protein [bacterium]